MEENLAPKKRANFQVCGKAKNNDTALAGYLKCLGRKNNVPREANRN